MFECEAEPYLGTCEARSFPYRYYEGLASSSKHVSTMILSAPLCSNKAV